jgi:ribose-phosphate pyrophosphokinase
LKKLYISDTIAFDIDKKIDKVDKVSAALIFAEAIRRTYNNESISSLFDIDKG